MLHMNISRILRKWYGIRAESNTLTSRTGFNDITGLLKQGKTSLCWSYIRIYSKSHHPNILRKIVRKKWTTRSCMLASSRCVACGAATAIPLESKTRSNSLAVKKNKPALVHRFLMRTKSSGTTRWRRWTVNVLEHDHKTVTSFHRTSKQRCCGALIITERNGLFRICLRNDWRKPWSIFIVI